MLQMGGNVNRQRIQKKMERLFAGTTAFVIRFRIPVLLVILICTGLAISQVRTLHLNIILSSYGLLAADGGFERAQLDYDINDQMVLTGGVILYESGDAPGLSGIGDNDNFFVEVNYNF